MTEREVYASIAACLRAQAESLARVNPTYAREMRKRAAMYARRALGCAV